MPDVSNYVERYDDESRRIEPFQQRPEWREWLGRMASELEDFFADVVPDLPEDPWTDAGLRAAEAAALRVFPDLAAADPDRRGSNRRLIDQFSRYLGEGLVRRFEGRWLLVDLDPDELQPAVGLPYASIYFGVRGSVTMAADRRTGSEWSKIFQYQDEDYRNWVEAGRPAPALWQKTLDDAFLGELGL